jgi:hypothetical protein
MMPLTETYSDTSPQRKAYFKDEVDARIKKLEDLLHTMQYEPYSTIRDWNDDIDRVLKEN